MALFGKIADSVRRQILDGSLKPGDPLPSVREMSERWGCAPGTVQRAYRELAAQGLIVSQVGQGSRVAERGEMHTPLRRATLVNQLEAFLLGVLAAGYSPHEVDSAMHEVLDRWQVRVELPATASQQVLRFVGSHDPIISMLASRISALAPDYILKLTFVGSFGGLMALARYGADIAGCHLWDRETGTYNRAHVKQLLPGRRIALLTLGHRRLGLIVPHGNPAGITGLRDLVRPDVRFINRQWGAGTRVWLEAQLEELGLSAEAINGYGDEVNTHLEVAGAVAEKRADVGLAVEAAALAYGLDFIRLTTERYDLVIPAEVWELPVIQRLVAWLNSDEAKAAILDLGGYEVEETGRVEWVE
ncbi:MAG TPA: substrate-binding domain-containing protein [Aggregatilineales bacterium]|nr:GntR family transcriptional regulator [Chloroflexota bacterium]HQE18320.1 substrate-binding domain-containing protein [Aggregatilineales bacterium]